MVNGEQFTSSSRVSLQDLYPKGTDGQFLQIDGYTVVWGPGGSSGIAIGDTVTGGTTGSLLFVGAASALAQDNGNFFIDDTNKRFGIGTASPSFDIEVQKASGLDGATPVSMRLYSTNSGTWTDEAIMAQLLFGSADTGGGAGTKAGVRAYIDDTSGSDIGLSFWASSSGATGFSEYMRIAHDGTVAIGTTATSTATTTHRFSVIGSGLQLFGSDVLTDDTNKQFRIGMPHYDNGTNTRPFIGWYMSAENAANNTFIGGGTSAGYAATRIAFMTAANSTTQTGSVRMNIDSTGRINFGNGTSQGAVNIVENRSFSGMTSAVSGRVLELAAITITDTDQSGTIGNRNAVTFRPTTFASTNSVTLTEAASFYIASAPVAGTNTTITNPYALWVDAGRTRLDGGLRLGYVAKTTAYTADVNTDYVINCTSGTFTVTLPTAVGNTGTVFVIKNSGAGTITVDTTSSQTIDGAATYSMPTQYQSVTVQSNGANWIII